MPDAVSTGRTVSLVVAHHGAPVGALPPFEVETPWWQDVEPITRRHRELAVLRLLDVRADHGAQSGGRVTYLVEPIDPDQPGASGALHPWDGQLGEDPHRMPWAVPGGPASDLEWARSKLAAGGTCVQHRTWNLSAIWSIESLETTTWLKCVPPFLQHEAAILDVLAGEAVPEVLATDGHRMLLAALPGRDGYDASLAERLALVDALVRLQVATIDKVEVLGSRGVPDRRLPRLVDAIADVVERRAPTSKVLREFCETAEARVAAIEACGLPTVLVHGDAHPGNARVGAGSHGIWFDWGDATIGHPLLDLGVLDRPGTAFREELRSHWLDAWRRAAQGCDPHRAWPLIRPFTPLVGAVVYQGFLDRIEASERPYHEADVPACLRRAERLLAE